MNLLWNSNAGLLDLCIGCILNLKYNSIENYFLKFREVTSSMSIFMFHADNYNVNDIIIKALTLRVQRHQSIKDIRSCSCRCES